jgi:hypothetical protein
MAWLEYRARDFRREGELTPKGEEVLREEQALFADLMLKIKRMLVRPLGHHSLYRVGTVVPPHELCASGIEYLTTDPKCAVRSVWSYYVDGGIVAWLLS